VAMCVCVCVWSHHLVHVCCRPRSSTQCLQRARLIQAFGERITYYRERTSSMFRKQALIYGPHLRCVRLRIRRVACTILVTSPRRLIASQRADKVAGISSALEFSEH
jgi:hypothetical protein